MGKVEDECERRETQVRRLNALEREVKVAKDRLDKANSGLDAAGEHYLRETSAIRDALEAEYALKTQALSQALNAAKSELGTATKLHNKALAANRAARTKMQALFATDDTAEERKLRDAAPHVAELRRWCTIEGQVGLGEYLENLCELLDILDPEESDEEEQEEADA